MSGTATRVLFNGTVHTLDERRSIASAIAVTGDRVLAAGGDEAMRDLAAPNAVLTDLRGRTVVPGLIDSHTHLLQTGLNAEHVDLSAARTLRDVLDAIGGRAARTEPGGWVVSSSRWHESQLDEQRFPSRDEWTPWRMGGRCCCAAAGTTSSPTAWRWRWRGSRKRRRIRAAERTCATGRAGSTAT